MAARKYRFERLTPIDNMDLNVYEEAIDYVFSNSDVKNVAISGAYSAGKSSVLASYKKKHGELRFLQRIYFTTFRAYIAALRLHIPEQLNFLSQYEI